MTPFVRQWALYMVGAVTVAIWLGSAQVRLAQEAKSAMDESDHAFDEGQLHGATAQAIRAGSSSSLDAQLVSRAVVRLRAIAVGSEATGRHSSALNAWSGLSTMSREPSLANGSATTFGREAQRHVEHLLRKGIEVRESAMHPAGRDPVVAVSSMQPIGSGRARWFLVAAILGVLGIVRSVRVRSHRTEQARPKGFLAELLLIAAAASWCAAWALV